jgi:DNA-binding NarL/FixJ family response regulator
MGKASLGSAIGVDVQVADQLVHDLVAARVAQLGLDRSDAPLRRVVRTSGGSQVPAGATEVVLIDHVDAEALDHCARRSVVAVLSYTAAPELLDVALHLPASKPGLVLDPLVASRLAGRDGRRFATADTPQLTARQVEIVSAVASGRSFKQVAVALGITVKTVENQASRIYAALGATNRHEAVQRARSAGFIDG